MQTTAITKIFAVFAVFLMASGAQGQWAVDDDGCRTPDRGVGTCMSIRTCQPIIDYLKQASRPLSQKDQDLLASYQCGYDNRGAKVCCPPKPIVGGGGGGNKGQSQQPPDVSSHRNLRLLPKNCGHLGTGDRIINGNKTGIFEFPWMALLSYNSPRGPSFRCGGTIINDRYILTAAHCITNLKSPLLGVRVGDHDWSKEVDCEFDEGGVEICAVPYQDLEIEQILPHPKYNATALTSDIGLLRVAKMNISVESVRPVCLPLGENRNYNFYNGKNVIVTGWGATNNEDGRSSPDLLKVQLPVVPHETCRKTYEKQVAINERQVCAGGSDRRDSCGGDSGGPLQVVGYAHGDTRYIQHGVVSFGTKVCAIEGNPGVYTKVAHYMDWILDTLRP